MTSNSDDLERALRDWALALEAPNVVDDPKTIAKYERATFSCDRSIAAVIKPGSRDEVLECVRIACQCHVPAPGVGAITRSGRISFAPLHESRPGIRGLAQHRNRSPDLSSPIL